MPECISLGALIRQRRLELGWTQEELAGRISTDDEYVRQSEISRIESGRTELPRRERLHRLGEVLGLPLGELLARSGWAGADLHFQQNGIADSVSDNAPSPGHVAEEIADLERHGDTHGRIFRWPNDPDAISALRRAVSRMHDETDRLNRNRNRSVEIVEQMRHRPGGRQDGDYVEPPAT